MTKTEIVTCNCAKCKGITAEVPSSLLAQSSVHKMVVIATQPYSANVGCKVLSR